MNEKSPSCFISYSWESEDHKNWVKELASRLRGHGIEVKLDQWHTAPGDQLPQFMEASVRDNDFVVVVCTPAYKDRADKRWGGVGYEGDIITGEIFVHGQNRKFIPILRHGKWEESAPTYCLGKYYIDFSEPMKEERSYRELLATLSGLREIPPPVGRIPKEALSAFLSQSASIKARTNWATLEFGEFPMVSESKASFTTWVASVRDGLIHAFGERDAFFAGVIQKREVQANSYSFPIYQVVSHQRRFVFDACQLHQGFVRQLLEARTTPNPEAIEALKRSAVERERGREEWRIDVNLRIDDRPRALVVRTNQA